jgi:hypothetical protein
MSMRVFNSERLPSAPTARRERLMESLEVAGSWRPCRTGAELSQRLDEAGALNQERELDKRERTATR